MMEKFFRRWTGLIALLALLCALAPTRPALAEVGVDVNTATEEDLVALPGIGPSKARAIIEYRAEHPFESVDELRNVRGIGEHTFETLKDKVRVGTATGSSKR